MIRSFRRLAWLWLVVLLAGLFAVTLTSAPPIRALLVTNSDTLLPAAWVQNLVNHPGTVTLFQLPRVPSFVPDLALYVLLTAALPSWQAVVLAYAVLSYVALVVLAGAVVARATGRRVAEGAGLFLALAVVAQLLDLVFRGSHGAFLFVFSPVVHSGSFVLSLGGLLLARRRMGEANWRVTTGLVVMAALGAMSDKLFLGSFFLPLLGASLVSGGVRRDWPTVLWAAVGCGAGLLLDRLIFPGLLSRQPDFPINLHEQAALLHTLLRDHSVWIAEAFAAVAVLLPLWWVRREREARFWWAAGAVSVIGFMGLLPLLYADAAATRYVQPVWWWGLIALAAAGLRLSSRWSLTGASVGALLAVVGVAQPGRDLLQPGRVLNYRIPVAACLAPLERSGRIHSGIAQYWLARVIEASSDWTIQVPQVVGAGRVFVWGNNPFYYRHRAEDSSRPPLFDFIVMQDLDTAGVKARFGPPSQVVHCPGSDVWLYATQGGIGGRIGLIATADGHDGRLSGSSCFGPMDFVGRSGPVGVEGATAAADARAHGVVTYGPYVRLAAGSWTLTFRYSLDGPTTGTEGFDVNTGAAVLTAGPLEAGEHRVKVVPVTVGKEASPLEFRTYLDPGDHIRIESLAVAQAGAAEPGCRP